MGSLFRSEEMALCQVYFQSEAAYLCVAELGELGLVQFRDLNPDVSCFQRKFMAEVHRCSEMERKLRYLEEETVKEGVPILDTFENPEAPLPREMINLEATVEKLESELMEVNASMTSLLKNFWELQELKHVLRKTQAFFDETETEEAAIISLVSDESEAAGRLMFLAGVINRERLPGFERMLWRVCHGNVFLKTEEIETPMKEPGRDGDARKSVFIVFIQGDGLKVKVRHICEGFHATLYPTPNSASQHRDMGISVITRMEEMSTVLGRTQDLRHRLLVSAAKNVRAWYTKVAKLKGVYHTLNKFNVDVTQQCLIAECWVPTADLGIIHVALQRGTERSGSGMPPILNVIGTDQPPPTYNRTNKFTQGFQNLIDAYGVATYREVNPAPFAIVTFPFLFAVMFGDVGHGMLMLLAALWMVFNEERQQARKGQSQIFSMFFGGRYIILLMGLFSIYTGLIYNDIFSKSINIFGSSFTTARLHNGTFPYPVQLNPNSTAGDYKGKPYPFGMDPIWQLASNKISFLNSYKMKNSIVLGVLQMLFGVLLSLRNHTHFKRPLNIWCEFVPQVLFLCSLFGYLVVLVFYKWVAFDADQSYCAPSILITLINMVLFKKTEIPKCEEEQFQFSGQNVVEKFLLFLVFISVPWMLFVKPMLVLLETKSVEAGAGKENPAVVGDRGAAVGDSNAGGGEGEQTTSKRSSPGSKDNPAVGGVSEPGEATSERSGSLDGGREAPRDENADLSAQHEDVAEIIIHQAIHTIEFALGSISHTASYLRLWALSLAHAQLSEVLWTMVLSVALKVEAWWGGVLLYIAFAFWAVLTIGVLVLMEGLSAFLHTLRLHWVEFQSKFYDGNGYPFMPFSFKVMLEEQLHAKHASED